VLRRGHYASPPGIISFKPLGGKPKPVTRKFPGCSPPSIPTLGERGGGGGDKKERAKGKGREEKRRKGRKGRGEEFGPPNVRDRSTPMTTTNSSLKKFI
jgi:hypothetical protein